MRERGLYILGVFLAWSVIFAHAVIPHHHHATEEDLENHHAQHPSHDHSHSHGLDHVLSDFFHAADVFTGTLSSLLIKNPAPALFYLADFVVPTFSIKELPIVVLPGSPPPEEHPVLQLLSCVAALRAP